MAVGNARGAGGNFLVVEQPHVPKKTLRFNGQKEEEENRSQGCQTSRQHTHLVLWGLLIERTQRAVAGGHQNLGGAQTLVLGM